MATLEYGITTVSKLCASHRFSCFLMQTCYRSLIAQLEASCVLNIEKPWPGSQWQVKQGTPRPVAGKPDRVGPIAFSHRRRPKCA